MSDDKESNQGHWEGAVADPCNHFGFIYRIDVAETGQAYIGKRQYWKAKPGAKHCKSKVADKGNSKWKSSCWSESKWRDYSGSSTSFSKFMEENPELTYTHTIIKNCRSRGVLSYSEAEYQWECKVLTELLPNEKYKYFNRQICGIRFRPKLFSSEETKMKLSKAKSGESHPMYGKTHTKEALAKISKAVRKENHPLWGKTHSEESKKKMSEVKRDKRIYKFINKDVEFLGTKYVFLETYPDTSLHCVDKLLSGKQKTHKGWSLIREGDNI